MPPMITLPAASAPSGTESPSPRGGKRVRNDESEEEPDPKSQRTRAGMTAGPRHMRPSETAGWKKIMDIIRSGGCAPDNINDIVEGIEAKIGRPLQPGKKMAIRDLKACSFDNKVEECLELLEANTELVKKVTKLQAEIQELTSRLKITTRNADAAAKKASASLTKNAHKLSKGVEKGKEKAVRTGGVVDVPLSLALTLAPMVVMLDSAEKLLSTTDQEDWSDRAVKWVVSAQALPEVRYM